MTLVPLFDLTQQFNSKNGAILVGGKLYIYYVGRTALATTWADEDGSATNTNPVLLDNNGRAPVFVDDGYTYTLVVCDRNGVELFSQDITPGGAGGGSGSRIVYHDETLTGDGTQTNLLGANAFPLGVDDTMTAYTGVADNKDALILGVNGDWFSANFLSTLDNKVDWSAFNSACNELSGELGSKMDSTAMSSYYTKTESDNLMTNYVKSSALSNTLQNYYNKSQTNDLLTNYVKTSSLNNTLQNYYTKTETDSALSSYVKTSALDDYYTKTETDNLLDQKQDTLSFGYDSSNNISSINNSALIGSEGGVAFPLTGSAAAGSDTAYYTNNTDCSSVNLSMVRGAIGIESYSKQTYNGVRFHTLYSDVSASWYNIIKAANNPSNTYCLHLNAAHTAASLEDYSAYDKLTVVHTKNTTASYKLYWENSAKVLTVPSASYFELYKGINEDGDTDWFFGNSGYTTQYFWDNS